MVILIRRLFEIILIVIIVLLSHKLYTEGTKKEGAQTIEIKPDHFSSGGKSEKKQIIHNVSDAHSGGVGENMASLIIDAVVSLSSDVLVEQGLSTFMRYSREDLLRIRNVKEFAKTVAKKSSLSDIDDKALNASAQTVEFTNTSSDNKTQAFDHEGFLESAHKITASFDASEYGSPFVVVRWYNAETQTLLSFDKQQITPYTKSTHIWLRRENWEGGRYVVDVFQENSDLTPLARGSFVVIEGQPRYGAELN